MSSRCRGARITRSLIGPMKRTSSRGQALRGYSCCTGIQPTQHSSHGLISLHRLDILLSYCALYTPIHGNDRQPIKVCRAHTDKRLFVAFDPLTINSLFMVAVAIFVAKAFGHSVGCRYSESPSEHTPVIRLIRQGSSDQYVLARGNIG